MRLGHSRGQTTPRRCAVRLCGVLKLPLLSMVSSREPPSLSMTAARSSGPRMVNIGAWTLSLSPPCAPRREDSSGA